MPNARILFENNRTMAFHDNYPVTKGHLLIVPKRHAYRFDHDSYKTKKPETLGASGFYNFL